VTRGKNEELVVRERPRDSHPSSRQVDAGQTDARPYRHRDEPILPAGGQAQVQHVLRRTALVPHPKGQDAHSRGGRRELKAIPSLPQLSSDQRAWVARAHAVKTSACPAYQRETG
jgi:hypothetical protein